MFCFCLIVAYATLTPVQFLFSRYTRFISWFEKLVRGRQDILSLGLSFSFQHCCFISIYLFIFNADKSTRIKTERHQLPISCQKLSTWFVCLFFRASTSTHYNNDYIAIITECKRFLLKKKKKRSLSLCQRVHVLIIKNKNNKNNNKNNPFGKTFQFTN